MQMFDRLKKTVTSVIGNPVCREYEITNQRGTCGPGGLWKIYDGRKKSTGQEVSVFVFEKKILEKIDKKSSELILEAMKCGPTNLARLRHPRLLVVQHPLEESRDSLAYATEPVFSSLSTILGDHGNFVSAVPKDVQDHELYDVEKVYGLYQIVEGLVFLHQDAKRLHGNLTTQSVVITKNGQWKITGLYFSKMATSSDQQASFSCRGWDSQLNPLCQPELNYTAPEHILSRTCSTSADLFSLGMFIYAVYNGGKPLCDCQGDISKYKKFVEKISQTSPSLGNVPSDVEEHVKYLLSVSPERRLDIHQLSKVQYFDNVAAQTLHYLDTLMQRDNMTKSQFFKSLYKIISMLPKRVVLQRVLPHLCLEFSNHAMIPFVLPNVLLIAENCSNEEYFELIFPKLIPVLKIQEPIQVVLILLKKMELLLTKTPKESIQHHVLPMVFLALEAPSDQVQELALTIIPNFAKMIEYAAMKHSIIPRIKTLCLKTSTFSVRVNCLVCLGKILEYLDKFLIIDEIFPLFLEVPSREPAVCMAILGIYKQTTVHKKLSLDKDYIAKSALPFLLPLSVEPGLNISQFSQFMSVIRELISRVETEQKAKLQQLKQMQEETKSSLAFAQEVQDSKQMDDLMGQVTNLLSTSSSAKTEKKDALNSDNKSGANGSAAFNKFFGFTNDGNESQSIKELQVNLSDTTSLTPVKSLNSNQPLTRSAGTSATTNTFLHSSVNRNLDMIAPPASQNTKFNGSANNVVTRNFPTQSSVLPSQPSQLGLRPSGVGNWPMGMFSMGAGGLSNNVGMMPGGNAASSWRPNAPQLGNTSFSLNSLEIPGFQSSQSHTKTLNQLKSMQGVQGQVATQVRGSPKVPPELMTTSPMHQLLTMGNQNSGSNAPIYNQNSEQQQNTDLLDIFG
ncbi:SCY1-like protein 2 isoform X2 [Xenia sp. Carnegie-2017]|uniref:SCY1-like protein 2 isoform X2 n=1 Tax=Xenia sp. Carnegie-2017 TaxID=2897299 RepID=UPI001F033CD7|nr:SCY1-like protein 2 isoform X2 [Xenia sp. Carnegie-2017]